MIACSTVNKPIRYWVEPKPPIKYEVNFLVVTNPINGILLDEESAKNLYKNINELDGYIAKLEVMVKEMKAYYKAK